MKTRSWNSRLSVLAIATAAALSASHASAATWTFIGDGTWQTAANWLGGVPTASTNASFTLANAYTVSFAASAQANLMNVSRGTLTFALGTNTLTSNGEFDIGDIAGQSATLNLSATTGGLTAGNHLLVGTYGSGTLNQTGGFLSIAPGYNLYLGYTGSTNGTYNLSAGSLNVGQILIVGNLVNGFGTLNATGGSIVAQQAWLGRTAASTGVVSLANASMTLGTFAVGGSDTGAGGSGTMTIGDGANLSVTGTTTLWSGGTLKLSSGTFKTGVLNTGNVASRFYNNWTGGALELTSPTTEVTLGSDGLLGTNAIVLNTPAKTLKTTYYVNVGNGSAASVTVSNGSTWTHNVAAGNSGGWILANGSSASGSTVTVDGTGSTVNITGTSDVRIGAYGSGILTIKNGGVFSTANGAGIGVNNISGIGIGSGVVNLQDAGSVLDIGASLRLAVASGTSGQLNISGGNATVAGSTVVTSGGTLNLSGGTLTTQALDASAGNMAFTGGTLVINGGAFASSGTTISIATSTSGSTSVGNTSVASGPSGSAMRSFLSLINGGTLSSANGYSQMIVGLNGGKGAVSVDGNGAEPTGDFLLGAGGTMNGSVFNGSDGSLSVTNGGRTGVSFIGYYGGTGRVTVEGVNANGAASSLGRNGGDLVVGGNRYGPGGGLQSDGALNLLNGGQASVSYTYIGNIGGKGQVAVDGVNADGHASKLRTNNLLVGYSRFGSAAGVAGQGTLNVFNGGQVTGLTSGFCQTYLGSNGGVGNITVDGVSSTGQASKLDVGNLYVGIYTYGITGTPPGEGTLAILNGGQVTGRTFVGYSSGIGWLTIDGVSANGIRSALHADRLSIGGYHEGISLDSTGFGTLMLTNGAQAVSTQYTTIGSSGGKGWASVDGMNSQLETDTYSALYVGFYRASFLTGKQGDGTLTLSGGGRVTSATTTAIGYFGGRGFVGIGRSDGMDAGNTILASPRLTLSELSSAFGSTADAGGILNIYPGGAVLITEGVTSYLNTANLNATQLNILGGTLSAGTVSNAALLNVSAGTLSTGTISGTGNTSVSGGRVITSSIAQAALNVSGTGLIDLTVGSAFSPASVIGTNAAGGTINFAGTGKLDLSNNLLVVNYASASPYANVRAAAASGYNAGLLDGGGLISQTAAGGSVVGVVEAVDLLGPSPTTFMGVAIDATTLLALPTLAGDANLDRTVDTRDFARLLTGFGGSPKWFAGDFDYSGTVNSFDFNALVANYGKTFAFAGELPAAPGAAVPEPAAASLIALAAMSLGRRRR